jgi:carotenoid cleavage dioxygenase-like enzyme
LIAGRIPPDLRGAYVRNGPNPLFKPIWYAYPMDGDGMIHAVYLDNGRSRYRNRFVQTSSLATECRAGRAVCGSIAHSVPIDRVMIGPEAILIRSRTALSSASCATAVTCSRSKRLHATSC